MISHVVSFPFLFSTFFLCWVSKNLLLYHRIIVMIISDKNICVNALSCKAVTSNRLSQMNQSVRILQTYDKFTMNVQSQPPTHMNQLGVKRSHLSQNLISFTAMLYIDVETHRLCIQHNAVEYGYFMHGFVWGIKEKV